MKVNLLGKGSITAINAYAPASSAEGEKVEQFYDDIERATADSHSKHKIILQEISMQELELKQKEKNSTALEIA